MLFICILDWYAYSVNDMALKEAPDEEKTSKSNKLLKFGPNGRVAWWRALVDAFNVWDLIVEIWWIMIWAFTASCSCCSRSQKSNYAKRISERATIASVADLFSDDAPVSHGGSEKRN
jgi:hypothetical protein